MPESCVAWQKDCVAQQEEYKTELAKICVCVRTLEQNAASGVPLPPDLEDHLAGLEVTAQAEANQRAQYVTSLAALRTRIYTLEQGMVTGAPQPPDVETRLTALEVAAQAEANRLRNELEAVGAHNSTLQQQLEHAQALAQCQVTEFSTRLAQLERQLQTLQ